MPSNYPWGNGVGSECLRPVGVCSSWTGVTAGQRAAGLVVVVVVVVVVGWFLKSRLGNRLNGWSQSVSAKHKKAHRAVSVFNDFVVFKNGVFFYPCWKAQTRQHQGVGLTLPGAPCGEPGAFEEVGRKHQIPFTNPSAIGTFSHLLPTENFPKSRPGGRKSLPQGLDPWLRDTPKLKPKSQSTFVGGIYTPWRASPMPRPTGQDPGPNLAAAQRGHAPRGVRVTGSAGSRTGSSLRDHSSRPGTLPATRAAAPEPLSRACENMYPSDHTSKHVPRELHDSYVIWGFRSRDFCILILSSVFESTVQEHEASM